MMRMAIIIIIIIISHDTCLQNILTLWVRKDLLCNFVMAYLVNTNGYESFNLEIVVKIDYILLASIV